MRVLRITAAAVAAALLAWPAAAEEEKKAERVPDPVLADLGRPLFERHCASCHGATGRGDGPAAAILRIEPADLTRIAARRGGKFPAGEIARTIDGRFDIPAHGSRAMPIWGYRFGADIPETELGEAIARGKIASLVEYLMTIQRPPL